MARAGRASLGLFLLPVLLRFGAGPRTALLRPPRAGVRTPRWGLQHPGAKHSAPPGRCGALNHAAAAQGVEVSFSHVHLYTDSLKPLEEYKALEAKLNAFAARPGALADVKSGREAWLELGRERGDHAAGDGEPVEWTAAGQDLVEQLLVSLGWRVTGSCHSGATRSLVLTSPDPEGVRFVVTAHGEHGISQLASAEDTEGTESAEAHGEAEWDHFDASHLSRFSRHRAGREGVAVLGFIVPEGGVEQIRASYAELHPKLILPGSPRSYPGAQVLEVFAYYQGEKCVSDADRGTVLRFVERAAGSPSHSVLPGLEPVEASFDGITMPAYSDHWVSNVVSREGFLETLEDTLGFLPKVDFNAGVVSAGEAQIESTVTGSDAKLQNGDPSAALRDQSQVFLPINNALSEVGHVHLYLQEIGQGVQHIASRVADLPGVVQRANDFREMTGAGLAFLAIPRSYYGVLTAKQLSKDAELEASDAERCLSSLRAAGLVDAAGVVELSAEREDVAAALPAWASETVLEHVLRARYGNLYALAGDVVSEDTYLKIVRNNILMDVQGDDILLQIFSCNVLQRACGEEAPFLEFIQRMCSRRPDPVTGKAQGARPGCGGFGIRNFLTLFLSIEVSKAAKAQADAEAAADVQASEYYGQMLELFASQLDESNPVLTAISDAMTAEGEAVRLGDAAAVERCEAEKKEGTEELQRISAKYRDLMAELRQGRAELANA